MHEECRKVEALTVGIIPEVITIIKSMLPLLKNKTLGGSRVFSVTLVRPRTLLSVLFWTGQEGEH